MSKSAAVLLVLFTAVSYPVVAARSPIAVSPGAAEGMATVGQACPTFSWSAVSTAEHYELVVYSFDGRGDRVDPGGEPAIRQVLPSGVTSWTPSLDRCPAPGRRYAWLVRALGSNEATLWSAPRFFEVVAAPTAQELEQALAVVRRYLETSSSQLVAQPERIESAVDPLPTATNQTAALSAATANSPSAASLATAAAAIRGELTETTGDTVGVLGISNSPDGAGLLAANTDAGNGADLILDGSSQGVTDATATQSGIDRASAGAETFNIQNSGTGDMTLQVDGVDVVTTASDSDTLEALGCAGGQIAQFTGALWVCSDTTVAAGSIGTTELADGAVTTVKIADGAVSGSKLGTSSVSSDKIVNATIQTADLGPQIVTEAQLATDAVTSIKIASDTITEFDLAADSVGGSELKGDAVSSFHIAANAVTDSEVSVAANISASKLQSTVMVEGESVSLLNNDAGFLAGAGDGLSESLGVVSVGAGSAITVGATTVGVTDDGIDGAQLADTITLDSLLTLVGQVSVGGTFDVEVDDANDSSVTNAMTLKHTTSGIAADGIGTGILLRAENSSGFLTTVADITGTLVANSPRATSLTFKTIFPPSAAPAVVLTLDDNGDVIVANSLAINGDLSVTGALNASSMSIGTSELEDASVTAAKLADGAVSGGLAGAIVDNTVTADDLAADSVGTSEISTDAVTSTEIADGTVTSADISNTAGITDAQINNDLTIDGGSIEGTAIGGILPAAGTFTLLAGTGDVDLGDSTLDTVTVTGTLDSHLIPDGPSRDLGSSTNRWGDLFVADAGLHLGSAGAEATISYDTVGDKLQFDRPISFEGPTIDVNETDLQITDPTADRTIILPDASGTVQLSGNDGSFAGLSASGSVDLGDMVSDTITLSGTIDSTIKVSDITASINKDSGSIVTEGGVGVEGNINAGGFGSFAALVATDAGLQVGTSTTYATEISDTGSFVLTFDSAAATNNASFEIRDGGDASSVTNTVLLRVNDRGDFQFFDDTAPTPESDLVFEMQDGDAGNPVLLSTTGDIQIGSSLFSENLDVRGTITASSAITATSATLSNGPGVAGKILCLTVTNQTGTCDDDPASTFGTCTCTAF